MTERHWVSERVLFRCWESLERRFYDEWVHGTLWSIAGFIGLMAALIGSYEWRFVAARLMLAAMVLGAGISVLQILGWLRLLSASPYAFLGALAQPRCPTPAARRYSLYLRLMEGGFVLLECVVLFGLLGLSTAFAATPSSKPEHFPLLLIFWVYGFFALTFGSRKALSAIAWGYWLRPRLEKELNWQGSDWLLASGSWGLMRFNLLRPLPRSVSSARPLIWAWRGLLACLLLMLVLFLLTFTALTFTR